MAGESVPVLLVDESLASGASKATEVAKHAKSMADAEDRATIQILSPPPIVGKPSPRGAAVGQEDMKKADDPSKPNASASMTVLWFSLAITCVPHAILEVLEWYGIYNGFEINVPCLFDATF